MELPDLEFEDDLPDLEFEDKKVKKNNIGGDLTALGVTAGVVGGAVLAHNTFYKPARQIKAKETMLDEMKKNFLNEPLIASEDLPARLAEKSAIVNQEKKLSIMSKEAEIATNKMDAKSLQQSLSKNLSSFDDTILSGSVDELSDSLTNKVPKFLKQTYANYDALLNRVEEELEKTGKNIMSDVFSSEVFENTIADAIESGVPEDKLGALFSIKEQISGKGVAPQAMSIKKMRGLVNSAKKDIPQEALFKLTERWGTFLENNVPNASAELSKGNTAYRQVAQMRKALYKTIDPNTGQFDRTKLNKMLFSYAKSKAETGLKETIKLIAQGNDMATPMAEVGESFQKLQGNIIKRSQIKEAGRKSLLESTKDISQKTAFVSQLKQEAEKAKLNTMRWIDKANKILSEQKNIAQKHPIRSGSIGKVVRRGVGVGERAAIATIARKSLGIMAFAPALLQAVELFVDPVKFMGDQFGADIPMKGTKERNILEKISKGEELTPEEKDFAYDPKGSLYSMLGGI